MQLKGLLMFLHCQVCTLTSDIIHSKVVQLQRKRLSVKERASRVVEANILGFMKQYLKHRHKTVYVYKT